MPKKSKKDQEELPSFLRALKTKPKEIHIPQEENKFEDYLGPVFFGGCHQYHPPFLYDVPRKPQRTGSLLPTVENVLDNIYLHKIPIVKKLEFQSFTSHVRRRKQYTDPFLHRCPGVKKVFAPEVTPRIVDFGETTSKIVGETSQEIPVCRLKRVSSSTSEEEVEVVKLSSLRERRRPYMSPQERAAHAHFLKEFVTIPVIGPTIPASITITHIPSKRRGISSYGFPPPPKATKKPEVARQAEGSRLDGKPIEIPQKEDRVATPNAKEDEGKTTTVESGGEQEVAGELGEEQTEGAEEEAEEEEASEGLAPVEEEEEEGEGQQQEEQDQGEEEANGEEIAEEGTTD